MTKEQFEEELRKQCRKYYADLRDGSRIERLEKRRKKKNSLSDLIKSEDPISENDKFNSCARTFGYVIEETARKYAEQQGADVEDNKKHMRTKIDLLFRYNGKIYNLESKTDIELDAGKSKIEFRRLGNLHQAAHALFDCDFDKTELITKIVTWTKPTSKVAAECLKHPLTENNILGYQDFFNIFGVQITEIEYEDIIRRVWKDEIQRYFTS